MTSENLAEFAQNIKDRAIDLQDREGVMEIGPLQISIDRISFNFNFQRKLTPEYEAFFMELYRRRNDQGSDGNISLEGALFEIKDLISNWQEALTPKNFQNPKYWLKLFDRVIRHPDLRKAYLEVLKDWLPDISHYPLDKRLVCDTLLKVNGESGNLLDVGCGLAGHTERWMDLLPRYNIFGIERQADVCRSERWKKRQGKLNLARADFSKGIPLSSNSIDAVIMQCVVSHITLNSLEKAIDEVKRVLKPDTGILFIGPQVTEDQNMWQVFKNNWVMDKDEHELVEVPLSMPYCY